MDTVFIEEKKDGLYRIAVIDRHRIFSAEHPEMLATVFECPANNPTREDDAQIFYALAPAIDATDFFSDLAAPHRSQKLNCWSIAAKNPDEENIFLAVEPLTRFDRLKLYSTRHSITPENTVTSDSHSLLSLVAFSDEKKWKTGILQECIDRLVKPEHRGNPVVYSAIDEQYRRILRFKVETEALDPEITGIKSEVLFIRRVLSSLGLKNSHDTTVFSTIPQSLALVLDSLDKLEPSSHGVWPDDLDGLPSDSPSCLRQLSDLLTKWSGARVVEVDGGYQLRVDETVSEGLSYMQPWLQRPNTLTILEAPM